LPECVNGAPEEYLIIDNTGKILYESCHTAYQGNLADAYCSQSRKLRNALPVVRDILKGDFASYKKKTKEYNSIFKTNRWSNWFKRWVKLLGKDFTAKDIRVYCYKQCFPGNPIPKDV
jgi:hypothetical protein